MARDDENTEQIGIVAMMKDCTNFIHQCSGGSILRQVLSSEEAGSRTSVESFGE